MKLYRVTNWDSLYENNRTRELKKLDWVPMPNKQDGDGYTMIMEHQDGAAIYGAFLACVQVASKCDPRGTLLRDGGKPHDFASLARITRIPVEIIKRAIEVLTDSDVNWLEISDIQVETENPASTCDFPALGCLEGKGREGKGIYTNGGDELAAAKYREAINRWFGRRTTTTWSDKEMRALKSVLTYNTPDADFATLDGWYSADIQGKDDFRRRDVLTLLNNWNGEIDRARNWVPAKAVSESCEFFPVPGFPGLDRKFTVNVGPTFEDFGCKPQHKDAFEMTLSSWRSWAAKVKGAAK